MKITRLALAALFLGVSAHAGVDACRTGKVLEKSFRLSIVPTNGSAPIELLMRFLDCRTVTTEPLFGDEVPPSASRRYRADGVAWAVELTTEDGTDTTELFVYYITPTPKVLTPVAFLKSSKTADIAGRRMDWGVSDYINFFPPKFNFSARTVTQ